MRKMIAVGLLALSCSPSAPSGAPIELTGISPSSGATLPVMACATAENPTAMCARQISGTFAVRVDDRLTGAYLHLEFMSGGTLCGIADSPPHNLVDGRGNLVQWGGTVYVANPPVNPCSRPFTSSTMVVTLHESGGARRASATFPAAYTFGTPAPRPTPQPTGATPAPTPADGFPTCAGARPSASCGLATGRCVNGEFTCSENRAGTCSANGGLQCVYCPGPIC